MGHQQVGRVDCHPEGRSGEVVRVIARARSRSPRDAGPADCGAQPGGTSTPPSIIHWLCANTRTSPVPVPGAPVLAVTVQSKRSVVALRRTGATNVGARDVADEEAIPKKGGLVGADGNGEVIPARHCRQAPLHPRRRKLDAPPLFKVVGHVASR